MFKIIQEQPRIKKKLWKHKQCADAMVRIVSNMFPNEEIRVEPVVINNSKGDNYDKKN